MYRIILSILLFTTLVTGSVCGACPVILERAEFRDRGRLTFFDYKETLKKEWKSFDDELEEAAVLRYPPGSPGSDVFPEILYGLILATRYSGGTLPPEERRNIILDLLMNGLLR